MERPLRMFAAAVLAFGLSQFVGGADAATRVHVLYSFSGGGDGGDPASGLTFDGAGNLYATTVVGGADGCGTVNQLQPAGKNLHDNVLYSFTCAGDGKNPYGGVVFDRGGNLYGSTVAGGSGLCAGDGCGTVFEVSTAGEAVLHDFGGTKDGFGPGGAVVFDQAGNLYGTTPDGGTHQMGTVYQLSPSGSGWTERVIHDFTGAKDGSTGSLGSLLVDGAGNLYGVTEAGGAGGTGTVYRLTAGTGGKWKLTTLYAFKGSPDAASPYGGLIADGSGNLYGTTYFGGTSGAGTVFELTPTSKGAWSEQVLYDFSGGTDGGNPTSTLIFDAAGDLYGTTSAGGTAGCQCGTIFELRLKTAAAPGFGAHRFRTAAFTEHVVHAFGGAGDGQYPYYGLSADSKGNLYGTTAAGGTYGGGTVFGFSPG